MEHTTRLLKKDWPPLETYLKEKIPLTIFHKKTPS